MSAFTSGAIVMIAVFMLVVCICTPTMVRVQERRTRIEEIRNEKKRKKRDFRIGTYLKRLEKKDRTRTARGYEAEDGGANASVLLDAGMRMKPGLFFIIRTVAALLLSVPASAYFLLSGTDNAVAAAAAVVVLFALGYMLPFLYAVRRGKRRKRILLDSMPDTMDLLSISTSAGLGFDAAVMKIAERDDSPCIQEFRIAVSDMQHGIDRKDAYRAMVKRCGLKEMTAFVSAVEQAEELGASLADVFREQAELLRENRRIRAEEAANRAPVRLTLPLVMFIFPSIFIILLGPAVIKITEVLGGAAI